MCDCTVVRVYEEKPVGTHRNVKRVHLGILVGSENHTWGVGGGQNSVRKDVERKRRRQRQFEVRTLNSVLVISVSSRHSLTNSRVQLSHKLFFVHLSHTHSTQVSLQSMYAARST